MVDLQTRCLRYLATIDDLTDRARVGQLLFGKAYAVDYAQRVHEERERRAG